MSIVRTKPIATLSIIGILGLLAILGHGSLQAQAQTSSAWSSSADCALCHSSQVDSAEETAHAILGCVGCHSDEEALATVHEDVDESTRAPRRLKTTEVTADTCLSCHGDGMIAAPSTNTPEEDASEPTEEASKTVEDSDATPAESSSKSAEAAPEKGDGNEEAEEEIPHTALISATAACTVLTDENGTTVNPHDLPAVEDHASITCVTCHKGHSSDTIEESAVKACALCHHENVFECYTCHE